MKVYRSSRASRVHFDPKCQYRHRTNRVSRPLVELELADAGSATFCRGCTPRELWIRPRTHHRVCTECSPTGRVFPCRHNGGVGVAVVNDVVQLGQPIRQVMVLYRWPENVLGAPLAGSVNEP